MRKVMASKSWNANWHQRDPNWDFWILVCIFSPCSFAWSHPLRKFLESMLKKMSTRVPSPCATSMCELRHPECDIHVRFSSCRILAGNTAKKSVLHEVDMILVIKKLLKLSAGASHQVRSGSHSWDSKKHRTIKFACSRHPRWVSIWWNRWNTIYLRNVCWRDGAHNGRCWTVFESLVHQLLEPSIRRLVQLVTEYMQLTNWQIH